MKYPISVTIMIKNAKTEKEVHYKYNALTSSPRLELLKIILKTMVKIKLL